MREVRELGLDGTEAEIRLASSLVASYYARGDMFSAQHLVSRVIERAEKLGSREAQGAAYWNASAVAAARGQLTDALELASRTLALLAEHAPDGSLAGMRITYAWLLLRCDPPRLDEADALLARAHDQLSELSFSPKLASCETEMARSALLRGDFDGAIRIAAKAIERSEEAGAAEGEDAKLVTGLALVLSGRAEEGATVAAAAAERLATMGSQLEAARAWRELAEALIQRDRAVEAVDALRRAADYAGVRASTIRAGLTVPVHD